MSEWLGFTPNYKTLFKKSTFLLSLDLSAAKEYIVKDNDVPALTLKAEKKGRKIIIREDIPVKRIEVHHESGSTTSFIPLIARPKVFRPKTSPYPVSACINPF